MSYFNVFLSLFVFIHCSTNKTIVLPFKKLTIESFDDKVKTVNDIFTYNIYTNISMGTPPNQVGHFIVQSKDYFYYRKLSLSYNNHKYNETYEEEISKKTNYWYDNSKSSSFVCIDDYDFIYSDYLYFKNINGSESKVNLTFNIFKINNKYKYGSIGLIKEKNPEETNKYFIDEIKKNELINKYYFTVLFEENNTLFNYNDNMYLGKLIIGEAPHQFNPEKYNETEEVTNYGNDFTLLINRLLVKKKESNYTEENFNMRISFTNGFIRGTNTYKNEVEKTFFEELRKNNLCSLENFEDNIYVSQHMTYVCLNNDEVQQKIKKFPNLYFEIKTNNLTFMFTYKELFKEFNGKLYFLISFMDNSYTDWTMNDYFLRKYITFFNYDSKTVSFYRDQVEKSNKDSEIQPDDDNKPTDYWKIIRIVLEVLAGVILIVVIVLLIKKYKSTRKKRANELTDDDNYEYIPEEEKKNPIV